MEIVPVIDLKAGQVVHAQGGRREAYAPVRSRLCAGSDPLDVVGGFLGLYPFATLYVADLDAIAGTGNNRPALERLRRAFPGLGLWVDSGVADEASARAWLAQGLGDLVVGSETQRDPDIIERLGDVAERAILSLDFRHDRFLGPPGLRAEARFWPSRVIVMTLGRVGSDRGPDLDLLAQIQAPAPAVRLFAAGGVRDVGDLTQLASRGVAGALVATALHLGRIDGAEIATAVAAPSRREAS